METTMYDQADNVEKYASMIDKYGISVVVAAVFITIAVMSMFIIMKSYLKIQKQIQNQQNEVQQQIQNQQSEMLKTILESLKGTKSGEDDNTHKDLVDTFTKINTPIRQVLESVSEQIESDRISVYVFHNGTNSTHGLPFIKITCLTEVMRKGTLITRKASIHTSMSAAMFDKSVPYLSKHEMAIISSTDNISDEFPVIKNILDSSGVKSAAFLALYDSDQNMLGIMISEFEEEKSEEELNMIMVDMVSSSRTITPILDYSDYQKNNY